MDARDRSTGDSSLSSSGMSEKLYENGCRECGNVSRAIGDLDAAEKVVVPVLLRGSAEAE